MSLAAAFRKAERPDEGRTVFVSVTEAGHFLLNRVLVMTNWDRRHWACWPKTFGRSKSLELCGFMGFDVGSSKLLHCWHRGFGHNLRSGILLPDWSRSSLVALRQVPDGSAMHWNSSSLSGPYLHFSARSHGKVRSCKRESLSRLSQHCMLRGPTSKGRTRMASTGPPSPRFPTHLSTMASQSRGNIPYLVLFRLLSV